MPELGSVMDLRPTGRVGPATGSFPGGQTTATARQAVDPEFAAKVYVEVTTACNLDCRMCMRAAWNEPIGHMPLSLYRRLVDQLRELPQAPLLTFAGYGEPTCHPEILPMLRLAKGIGAQVEVVTNGSRLDPDMVGALVDLEIDKVWFSIDGSEPRTYEAIRRGGRFQTLRDHIWSFYSARSRARRPIPRIGLVFVAMRSNVAQLAELHLLAMLVHASDVLVTNVLAHTPEMAREILYQRSVTAGRYCRSAEVPRVRLPRMDFSAESGGPLLDLMGRALGLELAGADLAEQTDRCPFIMNGATSVRWDGAVSPCPPLLHSHPVYMPNRRTWVREASYGSIAEDSLAEIWESPAYAGFREQVRAFRFSPCVSCGGCERALSNDEDCYGNTFPVCSRCLWAQGIVRCP